MKKYIGTEVIEAEPMAGFEAMLNGFNTGNSIDAGYHVRYEDGSVNWLSKDVFEKAYKVADTFEDRLVIEQQDLADKLLKLSLFVDSPKFPEVVTELNQRVLLLNQRESMSDYLHTLNERIKTL